MANPTNTTNTLAQFLQAAMQHGINNPAAGASGGRNLPPAGHLVQLGTRAPTRLTGTRQGTGSTPNAYAALKAAIASAPAPGLTVAQALAMLQAMGNPGFLGYALQTRTPKQGAPYAWFVAVAPKAASK